MLRKRLTIITLFVIVGMGVFFSYSTQAFGSAISRHIQDKSNDIYYSMPLNVDRNWYNPPLTVWPSPSLIRRTGLAYPLIDFTQPHNLIGESELGRLNEKMGHEMISVPPAAPAAQSGVIDYTTSGDPQVIYNVTRFDDPASPGCTATDCSLRGAINAAIAANDPNTVYIINLPAGTYSVTQGQLNLSNTNWLHLVIAGAGDHGSTVTTIDAGGNSRVFVVSNSAITLQDVMITGGYTLTGMAIHINTTTAEPLQVIRSTIENNTSTGRSNFDWLFNPLGAIHIHQGTFYLIDSAVQSNTAGGISTHRSSPSYEIHIDGSYIGDNEFIGLRLRHSAASTSGNLRQVTIQNSTIANNRNTAIRAMYVDTLNLRHVTLAYNLSGGYSIAGLDMSSVDASLAHTIIAHNTNSSGSNRNCRAGSNAQSFGYNLFTGSTCFSHALASDLSIDASQIDLGTLTGHPAYFPLEATSPALNAGNTTIFSTTETLGCLLNDQRGLPRGVVDGCDIGAYDSQQGTFNLADVATSLAAPVEHHEHFSLPLTMTIDNQGDAILHDVTVTTTVPDNSTYLRGGTRSGNTVTFNVGTIAGNSETSVILWVSETSFADTNVIESKPFTVEFTTGDGVSHSVTYNTVHTTQVLPRWPDGYVNGPISIYDNEIFDYSFSVNSFSSIDFNNTVITTVLPVSTTFVSANNGGTYDSGTNIVTWSGLTVPSGGGRTLNLQLQADDLPKGSSIQTNSNLYYARSGSYSWGLSASSRAYTYIHDRAATTDLTVTQEVFKITRVYRYFYNREVVQFRYEIQNGNHTYIRPLELRTKVPAGSECTDAGDRGPGSFWGTSDGGCIHYEKATFFLSPSSIVDPYEAPRMQMEVGFYDYDTGILYSSGGPIASCAADVQLTGAVPGVVYATNDLIVGNVIPDLAQVPIFSIETNQPDSTLTEGAEFTLYLTIENQGQVDGTNVNVSMPLPSGVAYINGGTLVGSQVQWNLGTLGVNQSRTVEVLVRATSSTITLANPHYTLTADGGFNHGCGSPTPEIAVFPASISYIAPSVVGADSVYDSYLVIENNSGDILNNVTITKALPSNVTYVSGGNYISATNIINWNNLTIAAGDTVTIPLQMQAPTSITAATIIRDDEPFNITIDGTTLSHAPVYILINPSGSIVVTGTETITTVVLPPVILSTTVTPLASYAPLEATFTNHSTGGDRYSWDFGDGTSQLTTAAISVTHTYTQPGVYTVTLMGTNGLMTPTLTHYVTAYPFDFIGSPQTGLIPLTVTFVSSATGSLWYQWDFGDNQQVTMTATQVTHVYTQSGIYTVSMMASNGFVTQSLTKTVYITATPKRTWKLVSSTAPNLVEHAMAYSPDLSQTVLYGGNAAGWPYESASWLLDDVGNFQEISGTTVTPPTRYGASLSYDSTNNVLVLFGGSDVNDISLNQTWLFDGTDWQAIAPATAPFSRTYHAVATDPLSGTSYLFGGNNGETHFNDLWQYENELWTTVSVSGTVPTARTLAAMAYDSQAQRLYLFGGRDRSGTVLSDFWMFDLATSNWTRLDDSGGGSGPPARMAHSLTYDEQRNQLVLVGGVAADGETILNDTWHYHQSWFQPSLRQLISARAYHQAVYEALRQQIILISNGEVWLYE